MRKHSNGVTLIELLLVVIIIGILIAVAIPSYRQFTMRSNRAEAHSLLLQTAANQEQFYLQNNTYADDTALSLGSPLGLGMMTSSVSGNYTLGIDSADVTGFEAVATAAQGQSADFECAVLAINEQGVRFGGSALGSKNDPDCW